MHSTLNYGISSKSISFDTSNGTSPLYCQITILRSNSWNCLVSGELMSWFNLTWRTCFLRIAQQAQPLWTSLSLSSRKATYSTKQKERITLETPSILSSSFGTSRLARSLYRDGMQRTWKSLRRAPNPRRNTLISSHSLTNTNAS